MPKYYDQHRSYVVERNALIGKKKIVADGYETESKTSSSVMAVGGIVNFVFLTRKLDRFSKKTKKEFGRKLKTACYAVSGQNFEAEISNSNSYCPYFVQ